MTFSDTDRDEVTLTWLSTLDSILKFVVTLTFPRQIATPLVSADAKADRVTIQCVPKATPVNGE